MRPWTIDELRELAPGFVMGTLTSDELALFNVAMSDPATASELEPELQAHRAALEYLATEQAITPPLSLKSRLSQRISKEHRDERLAETVEMPVASSVDVPPPDERPTNLTPRTLHVVYADDRRTGERRAVRITPPFSQASRRGRSVPVWATVGVLATAMAASLFFAFDLRSKVVHLQGELDSERVLRQRTAERLANRDSTVNLMTHAEANLVLVTLASKGGPDRTVQVFWNKRTGQAIVHASGFAQVANDRTYCLWLIRNGKPEAVQLFNPDPDGHRLMNAVAIPGSAEGVSAFAITEEPAAGSPAPTMTPFLVGAVAPK